MKSKTIKKVLRKKVDTWIESITDPKIQEMIKRNTIITGGSIASMLLKERVHDYDVYFENKETVEAVARYYVAQFIADNPDKSEPEVKVEEDRVKIHIKSDGAVSEGDLIQDDEELDEDVNENNTPEGKKKYRPIFMTNNAITLSDGIQIVIRFYGDPEQIHENYDFVHCTNWWRSKDDHLELRADAMRCLLARELRYQGSKYPLCSIIRTRKFIKRGFSINAGQYLKMAMQLNEMDLTDVNVLEDQLMGVDVTYFHKLIEAIRDREEDITPAYVATIIDRIF